jgi:hypothetical protein
MVYVPEVRTASPVRTGLEEFELQPNRIIPTSHHTSNSTTGKPPSNTKGDANDADMKPSTWQTAAGQTVICGANQAPCGINNGTTNYFVLGTPPPPVRSVSPEKITDAIATLSVATAGTRLRIDGVGQSPIWRALSIKSLGFFNWADGSRSRGCEPVATRSLHIQALAL